MINTKSFSDLKIVLDLYLATDSIKFVKSAFDFAKEAHKGQKRKSKAPYIYHPLEVATILAKLEQDPMTLCAALLHDTLEDCGVIEKDLIDHFGKEVADLVEGVTKLGKMYFGSEEEAQADHYQRLFIAMAKDLRVVIIKLADRLHNMRTLKFLVREKQQRIASETYEIFAPMAHKLGMGSLKWELEDLSFMYLDPENFKKIKKYVSSSRVEREAYLNKFITSLTTHLKEGKVKATVLGRPKHFNSIYRKLRSQKLKFSEIYDLLGVRITVSEIKHCYEVLGIVHSFYKPVEGRFKDYIAMPKSNMYQSLHSSVIGPRGKPIEIQIRTEEMNQIAEFGIAAHWKYKEGSKTVRHKREFSWLSQIVESQKETSDPGTYISNLKLDLFEDEVFVFTPKGEVHVLPHGATPIDFAYRIHTEIGHRCKGAKVNGQIVNLGYNLNNGDRVEILTSSREHPKLHWLEFAVTHHTRSKIKQWFRKQNKHLNIEKGKHDLERVLATAGIVPKEVLTAHDLSVLFKRYNAKDLDELYLFIGYGEVSSQSILRYFQQKTASDEASKDKKILENIKPFSSKKSSVQGILVLGEENIEVYLAKCCSPLPGDRVVGFITKGYGVSVHREDCRNILNLDETRLPRLVDVRWEEAETGQSFPVTLHIEAFDRIGLLNDLVSCITKSKTNMSEVKIKAYKDSSVRATVKLEVQDMKHLNQLRTALGGIQDVYKIYRG